MARTTRRNADEDEEETAAASEPLAATADAAARLTDAKSDDAVDDQSLKEDADSKAEGVEVSEDDVGDADSPALSSTAAAPASPSLPLPVEVTKYQGQDSWTAIWDPSMNQYYFHNQQSGETTWSNPLQGTEASSSAVASSSTLVSDESSGASSSSITNSGGAFGGIDPGLAYLDPKLAARASSSTPAFQARFNARTGRFQGDPTMTPDRVGEFKRGERQQEAFYDTALWQESLGGKGLQRGGEAVEGKAKRRVSAKELEQFRANKVAKKKRKLTAWLAD